MLQKTLFLFLLAISTAAAHDVNMLPRMQGNTFSVVMKFGHPGDYQMAVPERLVEWKALRPDGGVEVWTTQAVKDGIELVAKPLQTAAPGLWISVARYDNGN